MPNSAPETHRFEAEVDAVLRLVTHALYANREVFLRELVSNAVDALDKARILALSGEDLRPAEGEAAVRIVLDRDAKTLTVEDNGIGMTAEEARDNLGRIAHSGTRRFLEEVAKGARPDDAALIGQFGVGFYASFIVADRVVVDSLSAQPGAEAVRWASRGDGTFTLEPSDRTRRGTSVTLHIGERDASFLAPAVVERIVRRYSNYVLYPIELFEAGKDAPPRRINATKAFWTRSPKDISEEDYQAFYREFMGGFLLPGDEPLTHLHFSMDAPIQFHALLFVPGRAPMELLGEASRGVALYARHVLVMERAEKIVPVYLRFLRGVVDSEDVPLNVSREAVQDHQSVSAIRRQVTRKVLGHLETIATDNPETYAKIWERFGAFLKEGIHTDNAHRDTLARLLRYPTTASDGALVSLDEYVASMPEDQKAIYYITGTSMEDLAAAPHLEACRERKIPVLLMTDPVDEWVVMNLAEYAGRPLENVSRSTFELPAGTSGKNDEDGALSQLLSKARERLGERVADVRASQRLRSSVSCLVDPPDGIGANMERILKAAQRPVSVRPKILELNPRHRLVQAAEALADTAPDDDRLPVLIDLFCDMAELSQGTVTDPKATVSRIEAVLARFVPPAGGS